MRQLVYWLTYILDAKWMKFTQIIIEIIEKIQFYRKNTDIYLSYLSFTAIFLIQKYLIMTISKIGVSFVLLFSLMLIACDDDDLLNRKSEHYLNDCHHEITWDSLSISNEILGEWQWFHKYCVWGDFEGDSVSDKTVKVTFFENGTLNFQKDTLIKTLSWNVKSTGATNLFELKFDLFVNNINGFIRICDNEISFDDTPTDGCQNFFRKID